MARAFHRKAGAAWRSHVARPSSLARGAAGRATGDARTMPACARAAIDPEVAADEALVTRAPGRLRHDRLAPATRPGRPLHPTAPRGTPKGTPMATQVAPPILGYETHLRLPSRWR